MIVLNPMRMVRTDEYVQSSLVLVHKRTRQPGDLNVVKKRQNLFAIKHSTRSCHWEDVHSHDAAISFSP